MSPETLNAQAERREQKLQNISAQELGKRHEQAVGHLKEAEREATLARYAGPDPAAVTEGLPTVRDPLPEDREVAKWRGIVNDLATQYYYRENLEQRAKAGQDTQGREKLQAVRSADEELRMLGRVAAGAFEDEQDARDREYLMDKYGLTERDLEVKAPELIRQLQGERDVRAETALESGYDYDRMKGFEEKLEKAQAYREGQEHTARFAREHPYWASGASIPVGAVQGADYFGQLLGNVGHNDTEELGSYVPLDVYDMHATNFVRNVRGTVAQELEKKYGLEVGGQNVASFLYQTGMSMGDFLFHAMITGNFSGGLGGAGTELGRQAASDLSLAIMGSGAAANTTAEAIERGLSNRQAYTLGAVAGIAEIVTEKVSLEALLDKTSLSQSAMGYFLKNVLAEGSEEVASDLINWAADVMVSRDKSQWEQAIKEYQSQGYNEGEAFGLALKDQAMEMGLSFLGGAISGGVMAGASVAVNGVNQYFEQEQKTASGEEIGISYTQEEIGRIRREGKTFRNLVAGIDMSVSEFLQKWKNGRRSQQGEKLEKLYLGKMSQEVQKQVGTILGYEVGDRDFIITSDGAKHIINGHGDAAAEIARGNLPLTQAIIDALPEIVAHPDSIAPGKPEKKAPHRIGIIFKKTLSDGTAVYIQFDNSSRETFEGRTFYVKKEESSSSGIPASKETGILTSETTEPELSSNSILPQREEESKAKRADATKSTLADDTTADDILRDQSAVNFLTRRGGLELNSDMTQAEKRQAIKEAVERVARHGEDELE